MSESGRKIYTDTLGNGLPIIAEVIPSSQSASIGFFVRTGARDETVKEAGVSHFLEHMMFKGTKKRSALEITYELGNLAAHANAFTSEEMTVYYSSVIPESFEAMHELLADMLRPAIDPAEFDMEKKVILEEIALYKDRPHFYLYEHALMDFFGNHPAGKSVLGSTESVGAISRDEMADYFERRYAPANMVLVATGNISWETFRRDVELHCGWWKDYESRRTHQPFSAVKQRKDYRKRDLKQPHVLFISQGCSAQDEDRYALAVLANLIGDGSGSRLYWELVDTGLAESAGLEHDERDETGCFVAHVSTSPENLEKVCSIVQKVISDPLGFTDAELQQAKTKLKSRIVLSGELPMGRMMALGQEWTYRKRLHSLSDLMAKVDGITREKITSAVEKYPMKDWSEYRLLPE